MKFISFSDLKQRRVNASVRFLEELLGPDEEHCLLSTGGSSTTSGSIGDQDDDLDEELRRPVDNKYLRAWPKPYKSKPEYHIPFIKSGR